MIDWGNFFFVLLLALLYVPVMGILFGLLWEGYAWLFGIED